MARGLGLTHKKARIECGLFCGFPGAGKRSRTSDLPITNRLLYQLSYSGEERRVYRIYPLWDKQLEACKGAIGCEFAPRYRPLR